MGYGIRLKIVETHDIRSAVEKFNKKSLHSGQGSPAGFVILMGESAGPFAITCSSRGCPTAWHVMTSILSRKPLDFKL